MTGLVAVATALVLSVTGQASAQPAEAIDTGQVRTTGEVAPRDEAGTAAVGFVNHVTRTPTWIFQCPVAHCNHGDVVPAEVLSDICYVVSAEVEGNPYWDLVYVRTASKRFAGFIPEAYLQNRGQTTPC